MDNDNSTFGLSEQLKGARREADAAICELNRTFDEIQRVREELKTKYNDRRNVSELINYRFEWKAEAGRGWDREERKDFWDTTSHYTQDQSAINSQIDSLEKEQSDLWDRHNKAKEQKRQAVNVCRELEREIRVRKSRLSPGKSDCRFTFRAAARLRSGWLGLRPGTYGDLGIRAWTRGAFGGPTPGGQAPDGSVESPGPTRADIWFCTDPIQRTLTTSDPLPPPRGALVLIK